MYIREMYELFYKLRMEEETYVKRSHGEQCNFEGVTHVNMPLPYGWQKLTVCVVHPQLWYYLAF